MKNLLRISLILLFFSTNLYSATTWTEPNQTFDVNNAVSGTAVVSMLDFSSFVNVWFGPLVTPIPPPSFSGATVQVGSSVCDMVANGDPVADILNAGSNPCEIYDCDPNTLQELVAYDNSVLSALDECTSPCELYGALSDIYGGAQAVSDLLEYTIIHPCEIYACDPNTLQDLLAYDNSLLSALYDADCTSPCELYDALSDIYGGDQAVSDLLNYTDLHPCEIYACDPNTLQDLLAYDNSVLSALYDAGCTSPCELYGALSDIYGGAQAVSDLLNYTSIHPCEIYACDPNTLQDLLAYDNSVLSALYDAGCTSPCELYNALIALDGNVDQAVSDLLTNTSIHPCEIFECGPNTLQDLIAYDNSVLSALYDAGCTSPCELYDALSDIYGGAQAVSDLLNYTSIHPCEIYECDPNTLQELLEYDNSVLSALQQCTFPCELYDALISLHGNVDQAVSDLLTYTDLHPCEIYECDPNTLQVLIAQGITDDILITDCGVPPCEITNTCCYPPTLADTPVDESCSGIEDGSVTIIATGTGTFTYSLDGDGGTTVQPGNEFTGLATGLYTATVIVDGDPACTATVEFTIGTIPDVTPPSITCPSGDPIEEEFAVNPSFDEGTSGAGVQGWTSFGNVSTESDLPRTGTQHAKMFGNFTGGFNVTGFFIEELTVAGDEWEGSMYMLSPEGDAISGGNSALVKLAFFDAGGAEIAGFESPRITALSPQGEYIQLTASGIAPPGAAKVQLFAQHLQPGFDGGAVFVDDASMIKRSHGDGIFTRDNDPGECGAFVNIPSPIFSDNCDIIKCVQTDDLESYTPGSIFGQDPLWETWTPNTPIESGVVSSDQAQSGNQSLKITGDPIGGPVDQTYLLGNRASGDWEISYSLYIPSGNTAYTNLQKLETSAFMFEWAHQIYYNSDGSAYYQNNNTLTDFTYPQDAWFEVKHHIDIDNDISEFLIDGALIHSHPFSISSFGPGTLMSIGAIDFFPNSGLDPNPDAIPLFYVDDVSLCELLRPINDYNNTGLASDTYPVGTTPVTFTVTDAAGNMNTCSFTVTVNDTEPPTIACPENISVDVDPGNCGAVVTYTDPPIIDNCPEGTMSCSPASGSSFDLGTTVVICTATDAAGLTATCSFRVVVDPDQIPAVISCPPDVTLESGDSTEPIESETGPGTGTASATDNSDPDPDIEFYDVSTQDEDGIEGTCDDYDYTITRVWKATDACDNTTYCLQTITVVDNTPPVIDCPGDVMVTCEASLDPEDTGIATATDNSSETEPVISITHVDISSQTDNGSCSDYNYSLVRVWYAEDACGNSTFCKQTITVFDTTPPEITCPETLYVEPSDGLPEPDFAGGSTSDNCDGAVTVTFVSDVSDGLSEPETVTRTYLATDACGNTAECSHLIIIDDVTPPETTCPDPLVVSCIEDVPAPDINSVETNSDCGATVSYVGDVPSEETCPLIITRTYLATDECGNSITCEQTITVHDMTPPTMTCPEAVNVDCSEAIPAPDFEGGSTDDNCAAEVAVSHVSDVSDGNLNPEVITRTYRATDGCGNTVECTQTITVFDTEDPVISCPSDITAGVEGQTGEAYVQIDIPGVSDNCCGGPGPVATGDDCASAIDLVCGQTISGNTSSASSDDDLSFCGTSLTSGPGVWYHFVGTGEAVVATTCNPGTNYDTKLGVFSGSCGALECVDGNDDQDGATDPACVVSETGSSFNRASTVSFLSESGTDYYIYVTGFLELTGDFELSMTCTPAALASEEIASSFDPDAATRDANLAAQKLAEYEARWVDFERSPPDECGITMTNDITGTDDASGTYPLGTTTVNYLAVDARGNSSTCSFTVTVVDSEGPVLTCGEPVEVDNDAGLCSAALTLTPPAVSDNVTPSENMTPTNDAPSPFPVGETTVTWSAVDGDGNTGTCTQLVTVNDVEPPVIDEEGFVDFYEVPFDPEVCGAEVDVLPPTASDNCGIESMVNDYNGTSSGLDVYPAGKETDVTWTISFNDGTSESLTATVKVGKLNAATGLNTVCFPAQNKLKFKWTSAPGAQRYRIQMRDLFGNIVLTIDKYQATAVSHTLTMTDTLNAGNYQWRVISYCKMDDAPNLPGWQEYAKRYTSWKPLSLPCANQAALPFDDDSQSIKLLDDGVEANVYPNPTEGVFYLDTDLEDYTLEVYDLKGQLVFNETRMKKGITELDLQEAPNGMYLLKMYNNSAIMTKRITIQR